MHLHFAKQCCQADLDLELSEIFEFNFCCLNSFMFLIYVLKSLLPKFVFLCFPIFPINLECLQHNKNTFAMKWPSLTAKMEKGVNKENAW